MISRVEGHVCRDGGYGSGINRISELETGTFCFDVCF